MPRKPRRPKIQLQCLECKTTFMESVAYYELRGRKFCGRKCHSAYLERENTLEKAFLNHIKKSNEPDGCWVWTAAQTSTGYGLMGFRGKMIKTHRASWMIYRGEIPKGMFVCHSCDLNYPTGDTSYRLCCNPHHLWLGTNQENVDDMIQKKRHAHGKQASYSKLTEEQAIQIKRLLAEDKLSQDKIARQFGITRSNVLNIKLGNAWKHVGQTSQLRRRHQGQNRDSLTTKS